MNRTVFSLPEHSEYRTNGGLAVSRAVEHFTGHADRLDDLIDLLDRRRGVVLSSGTTVPGRYDSFDLGFSDPPLRLETVGSNFSLEALNARGEVLIAFLGDTLREPCVVIDREDRDAARRPHPARRSAGRRGPAHPPRQRDVAGARSGRRAWRQGRSRCSACSAPSPMTSCSRSKTSSRSARGKATSATSCCMCRIACWPTTAPPGAA